MMRGCRPLGLTLPPFCAVPRFRESRPGRGTGLAARAEEWMAGPARLDARGLSSPRDGRPALESSRHGGGTAPAVERGRDGSFA